MFEKLNLGSTSSAELETITGSTNNTTTTESKPKKNKSPKKPKESPPKLAKDAPKELHAIGTFFAGIATMKIDKTDLELSRTQRIIFEEKGIRYEYTRNKRHS